MYRVKEAKLHPEGLRSTRCDFPNPKAGFWCIICRVRESFTPSSLSTTLETGEKRRKILHDVKKNTGADYVPHSGVLGDKCPRGGVRCKFPDREGWWCKTCCDRTGFKPAANVTSEAMREARRQQAAAPGGGAA